MTFVFFLIRESRVRGQGFVPSRTILYSIDWESIDWESHLSTGGKQMRA